MKNLKVFSYKKSIIKRNINKILSTISTEFGLQIVSLEVNIVSSNIILELNKNYLNHNYNTDIITFNYSQNEKNIDGEIYISFEDAEQNSKRFNNSINEELKRLIIHGILHLLGYDDSTKEDKRKMTRLENKYLNCFKDLTIIK